MNFRSGQTIRTITTKKDKKITLRIIDKNDLDSLLKFANALSAEDTFVQLSGEHITRKKEKEYLDEILAAIHSQKKIFLVAIADGQIVASVSVSRGRMRKAHVGELAISVAKNWREEGIGQTLLETIISLAKKAGYRLIMLTCFENNFRAIHVYEKIGFIKAGNVPGAYYRKGEYFGEIIMYKTLL